MSKQLEAVYHVRSDAGSIEARARAIAVEQSVEMPVQAIEDETVRSSIVGRVVDIEELAAGTFEVRIALAAETVGEGPGQLLHLLVGNTSIHRADVLHHAELPPELVHGVG